MVAWEFSNHNLGSMVAISMKPILSDNLWLSSDFLSLITFSHCVLWFLLRAKFNSDSLLIIVTLAPLIPNGLFTG